MTITTYKGLYDYYKYFINYDNFALMDITKAVSSSGAGDGLDNT